MFFHHSNDLDNCVFINPLLAPTFKIVIVLDKDANEIEGSDKLDTTQKHTYLIGGEEYTYVASQLSNEATEIKWCFWVEGKDDKFSKSYFEIKKTDLKTEGDNFFLTSDSCEENTKQLEENAILSAKFVEEEHLVDGIKKDVSVLKVRFSKWLDTEKINVEVYKYNLVEKKGEPTGNSSSGDGFHFSPQQTVKSIHLAARPTAWKVKNKWTETYVKGFNAFAEEEFKRMAEQAVKDGSPNRSNSFDCADLVVTLYIKYAAKNSLPATFVSNRNSKHIYNQNDETYIFSYSYNKEGSVIPNKFKTKDFSDNPDEALAQFIEAVRTHTGAASLVTNGDLIPVTENDKINGKWYGIVHNEYKLGINHAQLLVGSEPNEYNQYAYVSGSTWIGEDSAEGGIWLAKRINMPDNIELNMNIAYMFKEMHKSNLDLEPIDFPETLPEEIKLFENVKFEPKKPVIKID